MKKFARKLMMALAIMTLILTIWVNFAYSADYIELAPLPGTGQNGVVKVGGAGNTLGNYINGLYRLVVAGASVLAVVMILVGGFSYVASDAIGNKEEGKSTIKNALGGLLLVFASWIIVNTINPQLTKINLANTELKTTTKLSDLYKQDQAAINEIVQKFKKVDTTQTAAEAREKRDTAKKVSDMSTKYNDLKKIQSLYSQKESLPLADQITLTGLISDYGNLYPGTPEFDNQLLLLENGLKGALDIPAEATTPDNLSERALNSAKRKSDEASAKLAELNLNNAIAENLKTGSAMNTKVRADYAERIKNQYLNETSQMYTGPYKLNDKTTYEQQAIKMKTDTNNAIKVLCEGITYGKNPPDQYAKEQQVNCKKNLIP